MGELSVIAAGSFQDEYSGLSHLDEIMPSAYFRCYSERDGRIIQSRVGTNGTDVRIDRIFVPTIKATQAGWPHGPFGVEGKKSGRKIGRAVSQAMDYSRSAFLLDHGFWVVLEWIFLWPYEAVQGDLGSVMAQNRIGYVWPCQGRRRAVFGAGGSNGIEIWADGSIKAKRLPMGAKSGNRG